MGVAGEARGEAGRGVPAQRMRLAHAPPALCEAARCFRGFISCSFELSPLTRTMLLLLRLLSRETRSLPPPSCVRRVRSAAPYARYAHSLRVVGFASRLSRAVFALCVRSAAARVVELVSASHEGDTHGSVAASVLRAKRRHRRWATSRLRAASSRPRLRRPVHITAEAAGLCRLPSKTWRCDGVSLNCRCSAVLF